MRENYETCELQVHSLLHMMNEFFLCINMALSEKGYIHGIFNLCTENNMWNLPFKSKSFSCCVAGLIWYYNNI